MGMTQKEIDDAVAKDRAVVVSKLDDFHQIRWLPSFRYDGKDALSRIADHINAGTISELSINLIEGGIQIIAFHHNTGIPSGKDLLYPFTVGEFEDALDKLDEECAEPPMEVEN